MVKFSKQFEGQLVPEWKQAFVDYWQLKKELKKMQQQAEEEEHGRTLTRTRSFLSPLGKLPFFSSAKNRDLGVIHVHRKLEGSGSKSDLYETELLAEQFADSDAAREFFVTLDSQLNKVNQFYRGKEREFVERGDSLKKQLDILLELKAALKQQQQQQQKEKEEDASGSFCEAKDDPSVSCSVNSEDELSRYVIDIEQGPESGAELARTEQRIGDSAKLTKQGSSEGQKLRSLSGRMVSCNRRNVKINIPLTTPSRTISALTDLVWDDFASQSRKSGTESSGNRLNFNKATLHRAEKMIRGAFVELYKGLGYLNTYRNLNMLAFAKILKKFDKVTGKQVLPVYLKVVESSYFNSSEKAVKLSDEVEEIFIKNFAEDDKRKAMLYLKPTQRKDSHGVTFFIGLFAGCFISLFIGYCILARVAGTYSTHSGSDSIYMETVYPVFSMFGLLFLHLFLYGCNIFMWRKTRINYSFIFEFAPTKELKYRDVFLICAASMTAVVGVMFAHLSLTVRGHTSPQVQAIPGFLLLMFLLTLICPFNIVYRSTRFLFLKIIRNIFLSPLYKVVMADFFMADQLCSQVPMLRSLEYIACYYISGGYRNQDFGYCTNTKHIRDLAYAVSFLPYYWRAMQCARRWFDEGEKSHLINLAKYVSAMLAAGAKVAYERDKSIGLLSLVVVVSSSATAYQLYWDFVKDWGLLQVGSKNAWLRDNLILKRKYIYYLSMGLNFLLRLAWLQSVIHPNLGNLDSRITTFFLAALEVIRRGQWNFYRLENEHLNNAGKFRAVNTVPLPFHEVDQD